MVKQIFEEAGYGGKQHNNHHHRHQQQQRNRQQSPEKSASDGIPRSAKPPVAEAGPEDIGHGGPTADEDPDMEAFCEKSSFEVKKINTKRKYDDNTGEAHQFSRSPRSDVSVCSTIGYKRPRSTFIIFVMI